ncbi:hypothetical protein L249_7532 [Ophiocordyceps polyrhachis-furcata BCC 54312]|uniref:Altered inheritance of mitochondria protein 24, mitochondrial n=1 Tax=Ophiocordyceps polyrhachis-furcata BCC 54312 TaxID=1330021 RepID=A0A367L9H8_9HYPO|nr:hypothetical protein L249_7532 [Ophiocordyceps polyrhachis-furcata BCC 54312]
MNRSLLAARSLRSIPSRRYIQISASPSSDAPTASVGETADARFEVLGSAFSLLSVTLSASQRLYTRRGSLVALAGEPANARSKLSLLNPLPRAPLGVPFLYQRVSATTPVTTLIATRSPATSVSVIQLDGTTDWMVSQRNALLAWTGHTLRLSAQIRTRLSVAHWGSTVVTGRGLVALSSPGQAYRLTLAEGETMAAHPASVVAYTVTREKPQPFRFKSSDMLHFEVPSVMVASWLGRIEWLRRLRGAPAYKALAQALWRLRTATRRTIWGDRLFLHFKGPATLLLSSRGVRVADVLGREQVDEMADAPVGVVDDALKRRRSGGGETTMTAVEDEGKDKAKTSSRLQVAEVAGDGRVTFHDEKKLKEFLR